MQPQRFRIGFSRASLLLLALALHPIPSVQGVFLPRIFGHNQVLQRGTNTAVWGWADPFETVTLDLQGEQAQTVQGEADAQGRWSLRFGALGASTGTHTLVASAASGSVTLTNLVIGDVWFCSGQSNMDMGMYGVSNSAAELADTAYPYLRLFQIRPVATGVAQAVDISFRALDNAATQQAWSVSRDATANLFSAVAYSFGRALHVASGVPQGLIQASVGATGIDLWTDPLAYDADPRFGVTNGFADTNYYNGSVAPITPLAIRGAVWYQGEAEGNAATGAYRYRDQLDLLIKSWRAAFPAGDFPFIAVQLHNWGAIDSTKHWDELRDSQNTILRTNHAAVVVGVDVGDPLNLHPANKIPLGQRAALAARAIAYSETNLLHQGPVLAAQQVAGSQVLLTFTNIGTGLVVKGGGELKGFLIAGPASNFLPATATILASNQIAVSHPRLTNPVAVRYSWYFNPQEANLVNSAGLPANSFRTDAFGQFSGGPGKLGELTFRGDLNRTTNDESATYRANLQRTGVYRTRGPSALTNLVWSFAAGNKIRGSVAIQDGRVIFPCNSTNIFALSETNGDLLWSFNAGLPSYALNLGQTNDFVSAPVFAGGVAVVPMKDKYIVLDPADGSYRYSYEAQPAYQDFDDRLAAPAVIDDQILFGGVARLYGLEPRTGYQQVYKALHWNSRSPAFTRCSPAVEGSLAYFTEPAFFSINLTNLSVAGLPINSDAMNTNPAPSTWAPCAALSGDAAVFTRTTQVMAVDLALRTTNWIHTGAASFDSVPAVYRGVVYAGCDDGKLYALNLSDGSLRWTFNAGAPVDSSPAIANGLIYFGAGNGKVYAVNQAGLEVSSFQTAGAVIGTPVIKDGVVFIGSDDGSLYALGGDDMHPPLLESATVITQSNVQLVFNEPLAPASATQTIHYAWSGGAQTTQALVSADGLTVTVLTTPLATGLVYTLAISNVTDVAGNAVQTTLTNLVYQEVQPTYTITYQGNGAIGGTAPADTNRYTAGQMITLPGNTGNLYRIGYAFGGWNTLASGSGTTYAAGAVFTMGNSNADLHAKWNAAGGAGLMAYEGFDLPAGENALAGTSGGAGSSGWIGIWTNTTVDVIEPGLSYGSLAVTGGAIRLDASTGAFRGLATSFNTGTVWISFLASVPNASSYAGVSFYNNFNNERAFIGDPSSGTNWAFQSTGLSPVYQSASNTQGAALLVVRIDWNTGVTNNDNVYFWVNPLLGAEPSPTNVAVAIPPLNLNPAGSGEVFNRVRIQQGGATDNAVFDELRIGRSWADVAPMQFDADGDGLPDAWELQALGSITNEAAGDADADHADNLSEYIAGTDPTNALSVLKVDNLYRPPGPGGFNVAVAGQSNRTYGLWRATNAWSSAAAWEEIENQGPLNTSSNIVLIDTNQPAAITWYQVKVRLP